MPALVIASAVLLWVGAIGCGGAHNPSDTVSQTDPSASRTTGIPSDPHNKQVFGFGKEATPAQRQAVTALVTRYYRAGAAADGATACSLIVPRVARSVPEDYGRAPGPRYLRGGKTCPAVMSRMFTHLSKRMKAEWATLKVTRVRLGPRGGYAVLRFGSPPERELTVVRNGGAWHVSSLLDSALF